MIDENCGVGAWKLFQTFTYFSSESPLEVLFYRNAVLAPQWWKELLTNVKTAVIPNHPQKTQDFTSTPHSMTIIWRGPTVFQYM